MKRSFILFLIKLLMITDASAQSIDFKTGDEQMDQQLQQLNEKAKANYIKFKARLKSAYHIKEAKVDYMVGELKMQPAEMLMAAAVGNIGGDPLQRVLKIYNGSGKEKGWGYMAKRFGIHKGSQSWRRLNGSVKNMLKRL